MLMEIDFDSPSSLGAERLMQFQIYDEEFPLKLRIYMEPIINKFNFYHGTLDFNSEDSEVIAHVDSVCKEAYSMLQNILGEIPRSGVEYVGVQEIYRFLENVIDPRQLMESLFYRLALEKEMLNTNMEDITEENRKFLEDYRERISKDILSMSTIMDQQSKFIDYLDQFHSNIAHNMIIFGRQSKATRPVKENEELLEKVNMQKERYRSEVISHNEKLKEDMEAMMAASTSLIDRMKALMDFSNKLQLNVRIRNIKALTSLIGTLRKIFSNMKENMTKLRRSIDFFVEKINNSVSYNSLQQRKPDMQLILESIEQAENILLKNSVVVSGEPQFSLRCLKKDKKLNNYELIIMLEKVPVSRCNISAYLLTENGLRRIKAALKNRKPFDITDADLGGQFRSKFASLEHDSSRGGYKVAFKDLTITVANRKHKAHQAVTQQKHVIMFSGSIEIDQQTVEIQCFSLPVIVAVHGNQTSKSLAAIFWDDYFQKENRSGLEVDFQVTWRQMSTALSHLFRRELDREPTASNMSYLKDRLMADVPNGQEINFEIFSKPSPRDNKLSFWEWLWGTMQFLMNDKTLLQLWKGNFIVGYINQGTAKTLLNQFRSNDVPLSNSEAERLFLIRFSESRKELITIQGHLYDSKLGWDVFSVKPYTSNDLTSISLSQRILDREDCGLVLYEDNNRWVRRPKNEVFQIELGSPEEPSLPYGYIAWTLKERTGDSDLWKFRIDPPDDAISDADFNPKEEQEFDIFDRPLIEWLNSPNQ